MAEMYGEIVQHVQSPNTYVGDLPCVFLAGGISSSKTSDWRIIMKEQIQLKCRGIVILNPTRDDFDSTNNRGQIKWEFDALRQSSVIIFWFPKDTLCPITLFELGTWSILHKYAGSHIIVGCDPAYAKIEDARIQLELLSDSTIPVLTSIEDVLLSFQKLCKALNYMA